MGVLVSPKSLKIERLPVDQEFSILDGDRPHAERLLVGIETLPLLPQFHDAGIQIGVQRLPEMHLFDRKLTSRSSALGDGFTFLILNGDVNLRFSLGLDAVSYPRIGSIDVRRNGDIACMSGRGGIEFDRALDACIVEKVKVGGIGHRLCTAWNFFLLIITRR